MFSFLMALEYPVALVCEIFPVDSQNQGDAPDIYITLDVSSRKCGYDLQRNIKLILLLISSLIHHV